MSDFEYRAEIDTQAMVDRIVEQINRRIDEKAVEQVRGRLAELGYRKCSECRERQGYYLDAETIQRQQERIAELEDKLAHAKAAYPGDFVFTYTDSEYDEMQRTLREKDASINALDKALTERDELIRDLWSGFECGVAKCCSQCPSSAKLGESECAIERRIEELGIEVDG